MKSLNIGIDLDNTIISYGDIFHRLAIEKQYISFDVPKNKKIIRDTIRLLPDGEIKWQKLQGLVYGPMILHATFIKGVFEFIKKALLNQCKIYIVSHKTNFSQYDPTKTNLRNAALMWMEKKSFFDPNYLGLKKDNIFFENNRLEKIKKIEELNCTHFIDDLEETFLEPSFPNHIHKILYSPFSEVVLNDIATFQTWERIRIHIFGS